MGLIVILISILAMQLGIAVFALTLRGVVYLVMLLNGEHSPIKDDMLSNEYTRLERV